MGPQGSCPFCPGLHCCFTVKHEPHVGRMWCYKCIIVRDGSTVPSFVISVFTVLTIAIRNLWSEPAHNRIFTFAHVFMWTQWDFYSASVQTKLFAKAPSLFNEWLTDTLLRWILFFCLSIRYLMRPNVLFMGLSSHFINTFYAQARLAILLFVKPKQKIKPLYVDSTTQETFDGAIPVYFFFR